MFLVEKQTGKIDKYGNKDIMTIFCKITIFDIARFMVSPSSNIVDNLIEENHKLNAKIVPFFLDFRENLLLITQ